MMMMSSLKLVLMFGAALGLYQINAQNTNHLPSVVAQYNTNKTDQLTSPTPALRLKPGFDYFMFVLQWPAAFCNIQRSMGWKPCKPYPLLLEHQHMFTVHGLWPQLNGAQSPLYCTSNHMMPDPNIFPFRNDLLEYWPDLFSARILQTRHSIWEKEWNKHGTCSSNVFRTPQQYLKAALGLAKLYSKRILHQLNISGIKPDGTTVRRPGALRQAVMKITGKYPILNIGLNGSGDRLLLEIKLCVEKDGVTLMDCERGCKFAAP